MTDQPDHPRDPYGGAPGESYGSSPPPAYGETSPAVAYGESSPAPPYGESSPVPAYGAWAPPTQAPYQGQPDWQGQQVWQAPQYGGQAPPWQSAYGRSNDPLAHARTADAGPRLGARILDWLILGVPFGALGLWLGQTAQTRVAADGTVQVWDAATIVLQLAEIVTRLGYHAAFVAFKGATPGKMACGVRVVDESTGARLSFGRALGREIVLSLSGLLCLVGYFSLFFDSLGLKRGWHDKAVKSRVIRT